MPPLPRRPKRAIPGHIEFTNLRYLATLVNPKDHHPYQIVTQRNSVYVIDPIDDPNTQAPNNIAFGYIDLEEHEVEGMSCARTHVPGAVAAQFQKRGYGLMLYSGLALLASVHGDACVASPTTERSGPADEWWEKAVKRGYAEQQGGGGIDYDACEYDVMQQSFWPDEHQLQEYVEQYHGETWTLEDHDTEVEAEVNYQVCPEGKALDFLESQKVFTSGLVLHWSPQLSGLVSQVKSVSKGERTFALPLEVMLGLDLRNNQSEDLLYYVFDQLRAMGASWAQLRQFGTRNVSAWSKKSWTEFVGPKPGQILLPGLHRGPADYDIFSKFSKSNPEYSATDIRRAWDNFYGPFLT